jgi:hypothetical protein
LIAQYYINVGLISEDNLEIDAALISQHGRVGRYYYQYKWNKPNSDCAEYGMRDTITVNGMIGSFERYGFAYTDGSAFANKSVISGYENRIINFDASFLYNPPPHFPLVSDIYEIVSWEELD